MRLQSDVTVEIAPRAPESAWFAFAGDSYPLSFVDAGRNFDIHGPSFRYFACPSAFFTGISDNLSGAAALMAGRDHLEKTASSRHLSASFAGWARAGRTSLGRAGAGTFAAGVLTREFYRLFSAFSYIMES